MNPLHRVLRGIGVVRASILFRGCRRGRLVNAQGWVHVVREGRIEIADRVQFVRGMIPTELRCDQGAELSIGAHTIFNYGASVHAMRHVRIGERCMVASMVSIRDADRARIAPVVIGDDVWIAHGATIEPGVTVGDGSVVSAGSVVVSDVPPRSLAIGNPAAIMPIGMMRGGSASA